MERKTRYIIAILWTFFVAFACLISFSNVNQMSAFNIPNIDKVVHFGFYTIFTGIWLWSVTVRINRVSKKRIFWVLSGAIVFGFIIELLQKYTTTTRSFEWLDVLANTTGAITGTIIFLILHRWTHKSQTFV